jgi:hypothetical protein
MLTRRCLPCIAAPLPSGVASKHGHPRQVKFDPFQSPEVLYWEGTGGGIGGGGCSPHSPHVLVVTHHKGSGSHSRVHMKWG